MKRIFRFESPEYEQTLFISLALSTSFTIYFYNFVVSHFFKKHHHRKLTIAIVFDGCSYLNTNAEKSFYECYLFPSIKKKTMIRECVPYLFIYAFFLLRLPSNINGLEVEGQNEKFDLRLQKEGYCFILARKQDQQFSKIRFHFF